MSAIKQLSMIDERAFSRMTKRWIAAENLAVRLLMKGDFPGSDRAMRDVKQYIKQVQELGGEAEQELVSALHEYEREFGPVLL